MSIGEIISIISVTIGLIGSIVGVYIKLKTDITSVQVALLSIEKNISKHESENNITFSRLVCAIDKVSEIQGAVIKNSEAVANIVANFDEHKKENERAFDQIAELVKQNRREQKEDHKELKLFLQR